MLFESNYNVWIDMPDNKKLCFNSLTSAFAEFDVDTLVIFDKLRSQTQSFTSEELDKISEIKKGMFIVEDYDEKGLLEKKHLTFLSSKFQSNILSLTILPTLDCNLRCTYCFEEHKKIRITEETKQRIREIVKNKVCNEGIKALFVNWYGGEPLLEYESIKDLSMFFIDLCEENKIPYTAEILTNSILLSDKTIGELEGLHIEKMQITLDGSRESHNKKRIFANEKGTFDMVLERIAKASEACIIDLRVNLDKDFASTIDEFFMDINNLPRNDKIFLYPGLLTSEITTYCASISEQCADVRLYSEIAPAFYEKAVKNGFHLTWYPSPSYGGCCASGVHSLVIMPDGNLCKCWSQVGIDEEYYANIHDYKGTFNHRNYYKWLLFDPYLIESCKGCSYFPICNAGCPAKWIKSTSETFKPIEKGDPCTASKYNIKEMLLLVYKTRKNLGLLEQKTLAL